MNPSSRGRYYIYYQFFMDSYDRSPMIRSSSRCFQSLSTVCNPPDKAAIPGDKYTLSMYMHLLTNSGDHASFIRGCSQLRISLTASSMYTTAERADPCQEQPFSTDRLSRLSLYFGRVILHVHTHM